MLPHRCPHCDRVLKLRGRRLLAALVLATIGGVVLGRVTRRTNQDA